MSVSPASNRNRFFGPLPTSGVWTVLDLTRTQFLVILALSVALFVLVGGPIWRHTHTSHFWRISVSYAAIPFAVAAALYRNGTARPVRIIVGSVVIGLLKLIVTALLLVVIALAQS